jgi:hypothetical protein
MKPQIARGVLRFLAKTQATAEDAQSEAQPGKIVHEIRKSEMARLGEVPFRQPIWLRPEIVTPPMRKHLANESVTLRWLRFPDFELVKLL